MQGLLTGDEVCELLRISKPTLHRLTARREIPFVRISGKAYRFRPEEIEIWAQERHEGPEVAIPEGGDN